MAKDRARDDRRSVGSHEKMMGALGKSTGYSSWHDDLGTRLTMRTSDDGKLDNKSLFAPGAGHVTTGPKLVEVEGTTGVRSTDAKGNYDTSYRTVKNGYKGE